MKNWEPPQGYIEKKFNYTYKLTFKNDERYYYYGVHSTNLNPENDGYYGSGGNVRKYKALYGKDCFKKEILEYFPTRKEALLAEDKLVPLEVLEDEFCLNIIQGGGLLDTTGMKMSNEIEEAIRNRFLGKKRKKESIEKMVETRRRRGTDRHSEETKRKIGEKRRGKICVVKNEVVRVISKEELEKYQEDGWERGLSKERNKKVASTKMGEKNPMYGKHWSEESKRKMLETKYKNGTNFHSEHTKQILAEKNRKKAQDPEFRKKLSEAAKGKNAWSKGRKRINKDGVTKAVLPEEVEKYIKEGWQLGHGYAAGRKKI